MLAQVHSLSFIFCYRFAWGLSLLLWPPWIYSWPYLEGERTVPDNECYIQFIETNHYITFGTAIIAFYVPVTMMCCLYWRIWRETKKRQKDLPNLQAGKKDSSKRSNSRWVDATFSELGGSSRRISDGLICTIFHLFGSWQQLKLPIFNKNKNRRTGIVVFPLQFLCL